MLSVTALINTYNYGRYVGEAIESVLAQDYPQEEVEILVVDDGSTDDTAERVQQFGSRVRYLRKENGGQASALNLGIAQAQGEMVALLDGDDTWRPGKLRSILAEFEKDNRVGCVYHPLETWAMPGVPAAPERAFHAVSGWVPASAEAARDYYPPPSSGLAFRKTVLDRLVPIPAGLVIGADAFLSELAMFLAPVCAIDDKLARYRVHGANLYQSTSAEEDLEATRRKWTCVSALLSGMRDWLPRHGFPLDEPVVLQRLKRWGLYEQELRFRLGGGTRAELASFLREQRKHHRDAWSPGYRLYRLGMDGVAVMLGYRRFDALRRRFKRLTKLESARRGMVGMLGEGRW